MPSYFSLKFTVEQAMKAMGGVEWKYNSTLSSTSELDGGGWPTLRPVALPQRMTRCPLYRRLGWPQGRSGRERKNSPPPGFDPRTAQPVASRYTDWAIYKFLVRKDIYIVSEGYVTFGAYWNTGGWK